MESMSGQVVDADVMRRMRAELGDAGLEALAQLFVEQTPRLMNQLREAVDRRDATTARHMAQLLGRKLQGPRRGGSGDALRRTRARRCLRQRAGEEARGHLRDDARAVLRTPQPAHGGSSGPRPGTKNVNTPATEPALVLVIENNAVTRTTISTVLRNARLRTAEARDDN